MKSRLILAMTQNIFTDQILWLVNGDLSEETKSDMWTNTFFPVFQLLLKVEKELHPLSEWILHNKRLSFR